MERKLSSLVLTDVLDFVLGKHLTLWVIEQPIDFTFAMTLLTLYHDLEMVGYQRLLRLASVDFHISDKSLRHNSTIIRRVLYEWGRSKIVEGDQESWTAASINVSLPNSVKPPILWLVSTDIL